mmetsp:Transcript_18424/g.40289  ORF Transcript_18424/g.40289 Transcript_18424/m.40289 type:complete len:82 (+) Transcript_18424:195-440(+)
MRSQQNTLRGLLLSPLPNNSPPTFYQRWRKSEFHSISRNTPTEVFVAAFPTCCTKDASQLNKTSGYALLTFPMLQSGSPPL